MPDRIARRGQIALGLLWLADGALQCQPYMFGTSFVTGVLLPSAVGQPRFIGAPLTWLAHLIEPHVAVFDGFAAATQVLIGLGLLYRPTVRAALVISFVWALAVWIAGEGLGMLLTGSASPLSGARGAAVCTAGAAARTGAVHPCALLQPSAAEQSPFQIDMCGHLDRVGGSAEPEFVGPGRDPPLPRVAVEVREEPGVDGQRDLT
jgi:hypothetical protein